MEVRDSSRRRRWFRCMAVSVSLLAAVLCAEIGVRLFSSQGFSLLVKDGVVGQRYRPGFNGAMFVPESGRKVHLRFNSLGYRGPEVSPNKPVGVRRAAVLGDSFVAAVAVEEEDTMVGQLRDRLEHVSGESWEVLNFGVSGNSSGQSLLTWRNFARRFEPDLVILCFYNGNDLAENMPGLSTANRPYFYLDESGRLCEKTMSEGRATLSRWLAEHSQLYVWQKHRVRIIRDLFRSSAKVLPPGFHILNSQPSAEFEEAWRVTESILATLAQEVRESNAEFILVSIPSHEQLDSERWRSMMEMLDSTARAAFDPDHPEKRLEEICHRHDIQFLPLVHAFRQVDGEELHFQSEGHWTETGNRLAADSILEFLATQQVAGISGDRMTATPEQSMHR